MWNLFLSTLGMMGLTFAIGFVVAGIIRFIAFWADYFDFYHLHQDELARLKKMRRLHQRDLVGWGAFSPLRKDDSDYELANYYQGENDAPSDPEDLQQYYHETSSGVSDQRLMDFYYPSNANILILEHQKQEAEQRGNAATEKNN